MHNHQNIKFLFFRVYTRIKKFEQTLSDTLRVTTRGRGLRESDREVSKTSAARFLSAGRGRSSYQFKSFRTSQAEDKIENDNDHQNDEEDDRFPMKSSQRFFKKVSKMKQMRPDSARKFDNNLCKERDGKSDKESPTERNCILLPREARDGRDKNSSLKRQRSSLGNFIRNTSPTKRKGEQRKKRNSLTAPRKREVLLSRISIYIVFMFVICHR